MSRRVDAPVTNTPPLVAVLQAAAVTCAQHCPYPHDYPGADCPVLATIPRDGEPVQATIDAVAAIVGEMDEDRRARWRAQSSPGVGSLSAFLRSELRRWAVTNYHRDGR